jgi:23S rRNA A2030 N6-methylase RlmJ
VIDERVGAALDRNLGSPVAPGEQVEHELDAFIEKRHMQRVKQEEDSAEEEAWKESSRRAEDARREKNRAAWCEHHLSQADRLRANLTALINHHEAEAEKHLSERT